TRGFPVPRPAPARRSRLVAGQVAGDRNRSRCEVLFAYPCGAEATERRNAELAAAFRGGSVGACDGGIRGLRRCWFLPCSHTRDAEQRLDAELRFHLEKRINDYIAAGLSPEEARRQANLAFGGFEQVKQDCREAHFESHIESLLGDFRYAFRSLAKDRRFALV